MSSPPPTFLTLPVELRSKIFYLALLNTPEIRAPDPPYRYSLDLSLLLTNRQVYYETRSIPLALHYVGNKYDPKVDFLSSLRLRPFQKAALKTLAIEYLYPGDLTHFLALGSDTGYLFGETALDLDLLVIYADDWTVNGARRWRYTASPEDVHYHLPKSSRWLRALCGLKGWKQLKIVFTTRDLVNEYWNRDGFIQTLFDDFRSCPGRLDDDFTIWHESRDEWTENIIVLRTKELGRYKQPEWWRVDVGRLMEGRECVLGRSMAINEVLTKFSLGSLLVAALILDWTIAKLARYYLFDK
ncbi:MAG: hypothetical protein Q9175_007230 [Cornicularia normoerica]